MSSSLRIITILGLALVLGLSGCGGTSGGVTQMAMGLLGSLGGNPDLSTLTGLVESVGVDKLLGGLGGQAFTMLAPTNDAFASLGSDALSSLTDPGNVDQLTNVLQSHIIPGKVTADALGSMADAPTNMLGNPLAVGDGMIGGANLLGGDIPTDNGLVQKIDKVIMP